MANIRGYNVAAPVVPYTTDDIFPSHFATYGKGGWRSVADKAERDTIKPQRLEVGMVVVTLSDAKWWELLSTTYPLSDANWKEVTAPTHANDLKGGLHQYETYAQMVGMNPAKKQTGMKAVVWNDADVTKRATYILNADGSWTREVITAAAIFPLYDPTVSYKAPVVVKYFTGNSWRIFESLHLGSGMLHPAPLGVDTDTWWRELSPAGVIGWDAITGKPTTIAGYGITDAFTKVQADALYASLNHTHDDRYASINHNHDTLYSKLGHTHALTEVVGLMDGALINADLLPPYAVAEHSHAWLDITDKPLAFPPSPHLHEIVDVNGLQGELDGKAPLEHTHLTQMSVVQDSLGYKLLNDTEVPGNKMYYGTGVAGVKGWHLLTDEVGAKNLNELTDVIITTPTSGQMIRFNGTHWVNQDYVPGTGGETEGIVPVWERFPANGANSFTLTNPSRGVTLVEIDGRIQMPGADFTVSGQTITLTGGPLPAGETLSVLYVSVYNLSASEHTHVWNDITLTPTTLSGYGIVDAYTKVEADALFALIDHTHPEYLTQAQADVLYAAIDHTHAFLTKDEADTYYATINHTHAWADIHTTPTTLAGYGITDGLTKALADTYYAALNHTHDWASITGKPTEFTPAAHTHDEYLTQPEGDALYSPLGHAHALNELTDVVVTSPTTGQVLKFDGVNWVNGTDTEGLTKAEADGYYSLLGHTHDEYLTQPEGDALYAPISHTHLWAHITDKPTTFAPTPHTHLWADITDKPTAFNPIAHTHEISEINGLITALGGKADLGHTHALTELSDVVAGAAVTGEFLGFDGTNWVNVPAPTGGEGAQFGVAPTWQFFTANTDRHTVSGTLAGVLLVMIDGRIQREGVDYWQEGQDVVLANPLPVSSQLGVQYVSGFGVTLGWKHFTTGTTTFDIAEDVAKISLVEVDGRIQRPTTDYTVSGTVITLTYALPAGSTLGVQLLMDAVGGAAGNTGPVEWSTILNKPTEFQPVAHTHDEYLTEPEGDARYAAKVHAHAWDDVTGKPTTFDSTPHTHDEYLTQPEGDALYAGISHTHDYSTVYAPIVHTHDEYLTEAEGDARYSALGHTHNYAATSHTHTDYVPFNTNTSYNRSYQSTNFEQVAQDSITQGWSSSSWTYNKDTRIKGWNGVNMYYRRTTDVQVEQADGAEWQSIAEHQVNSQYQSDTATNQVYARYYKGNVLQVAEQRNTVTSSEGYTTLRSGYLNYTGLIETEAKVTVKSGNAISAASVDFDVMHRENSGPFVASRFQVKVDGLYWNSVKMVFGDLNKADADTYYAALNHTHDYSAVYAPLAHTHEEYLTQAEGDALYAGVGHTHDYSAVYAPIAHNHDGTYATAGHNHAGVYEPVFTKNTAFNKNFGTGAGDVAQGNHNHDGSYAVLGHNHNGVYAPFTHTHVPTETGLLGTNGLILPQYLPAVQEPQAPANTSWLEQPTVVQNGSNADVSAGSASFNGVTKTYAPISFPITFASVGKIRQDAVVAKSDSTYQYVTGTEGNTASTPTIPAGTLWAAYIIITDAGATVQKNGTTIRVVQSTGTSTKDVMSQNASTLAFAPIGHTHDYSAVYAPLNHNHDAAYAALNHTHAGVYAPIAHTHSGADITTGTVNDARLSGNVAMRNSPNTFAETQTFAKSVNLADFNSAAVTGSMTNFSTGRQPLAIGSSPFAGMWHDLLAFCKVSTPVQEKTADGATWVADTLAKSLFAQKQINYFNFVVDDADNKLGTRWTWDSMSWSSGAWLVLGFGYEEVTTSVTTELASSADGVTWTVRHTSTYTSSGDIRYHYLQAYSGDRYLRLTIQGTALQGKVELGSIKLLTARPSDQGQGSELEFPYTWDENQVMFMTMLGVNIANSPQGRLHVRGSNSTSAANALFVENSNGVQLLRVDNAGNTYANTLYEGGTLLSAKYAAIGHTHDYSGTYAPLNHNHALSTLSNVSITSPTDGQVLKYQGGVWVNGADLVGEAGGGMTKSEADTYYATISHTHTNLHTHPNKTVLDGITGAGDGTLFLANDGTYKAANSGGGAGYAGLSDANTFNALNTFAGGIVVKGTTNDNTAHALRVESLDGTAMLEMPNDGSFGVWRDGYRGLVLLSDGMQLTGTTAITNSSNLRFEAQPLNNYKIASTANLTVEAQVLYQTAVDVVVNGSSGVGHGTVSLTVNDTVGFQLSGPNSLGRGVFSWGGHDPLYARVAVIPAEAGETGVMVVQRTGQTAPLLSAVASDETTVLAGIDKDGKFFDTAGKLTSGATFSNEVFSI